MSNVQSLFRSLVIYAVCIPLAVFLGYRLSDPLNRGSFITGALVLMLLCAPLLMRFHYPLMLLSWNLGAVLFFLPGRPQLAFATIALSFAFSITQRILNREMKPISVPALIWPILAIAAVVVITGMCTGGIGVRALGGNVYGGKRYFYIFLAIIGYYALTAHRIPLDRANRYVGLFFLGGLAYAIGDLFPLFSSPFYVLFWLFPPSLMEQLEFGITRFGGLGLACDAAFAFMLAKYGIRNIFDLTRPWRLLAFLVFTALGALGGFRSVLLSFMLVFTLQFFLEGLHRSRLLPVLALSLTLIGAVAVPFVSKLPFTVQRALSFLPLPIDPVARQSAQVSSEWRLRMWRALLPQVSQYFWLGKGLAMSQQDFSDAVQHGSIGGFEDQWGASLAGDYHNGPLSVIIPFGIWGLMAWIWFLAAGTKVLYRNYRYGDTGLRIINTYLFAAFLGRMLMFWFVVGGFYLDLMYYTGLLGLSVSLNGGVARPEIATQETQPQPAVSGFILRPRPAWRA
jgi:hypothetical protein